MTNNTDISPSESPSGSEGTTSEYYDENVVRARVLELKKRKLEIAKTVGLLFYKPHLKQQMFHATGDFKYRLARCGNRFGKSDMGVSEDLAFALGERPWIPVGNPLRTIGIPEHPTKGLIVAADWDKVDEIFTGDGKKSHIGKIWKKIPKDLIIGTPRRNNNGVIDHFLVKGKYGISSISFDTRKSFAANPMGSESSDWDWIHVDEPIEQAHWKAISRGLADRDGKAWFTCTLLEQPWISDLFFANGEDPGSKTVEVVDPQTGRKMRWVMTGSIFDNPYLSKEAVLDYINSLTEEERNCRAYGIPLHLSGLVYKQFKHEQHILTEVPRGWKDYATPPKDYTIYVRIDPHPRTPHAVLFAAVSPQEQIFIYDEIFEHCLAHELRGKILQKLNGRTAHCIKMDPCAWIEDPITGTTMADEIECEGFYGIEKASKDLSRGIMTTQEYLSTPNLVYFSPMLRTTLWEIGRYAWASKNGVPLNHPVDKDDHMMENLRRLFIDHPTYVNTDSYSESVREEKFNTRSFVL